jgi:hypothetical protein
MDTAAASTPPSARASSPTLDSLQDQLDDVGARLLTLTQRFEAHAEQEEERSKRTSDKLDSLTGELHKLGALPATLLPNLLAQGTEQQGATGPAALTLSVLSGIVWLLLPRLSGWLRRGQP